MNLQIIEIFNPIGSMYPIPTLYQSCQSEKSFNFRVEPGANHGNVNKGYTPQK